MKTILALLLTLVSSLYYSQDLNYQVTMRNNKVGEVNVLYTVDTELDLIKVNVKSKVTFKLIKNVEVTYKLLTVYKNGALSYSSVTTYVNGSEHSNTYTEKHGKNYKIITKGDTTLFNKPITYSGALLYFKEPVNNLFNYSEIEGVEKNFKKVSEHTYRVTDPKNGQIADYIYKNGVLESAVIHHTIMNFKLTKI